MQNCILILIIKQKESEWKYEYYNLWNTIVKEYN